MGRDSLIRRMWSVTRQKLEDGALAILFLAALVLGTPSAISGFRKIIEPVPSIGIAALAKSEAGDSARMPLLGFGAAPAGYPPQILFPAESKGTRAWLPPHLGALSAPELAAHDPVIAICIDDMGEDRARTDKAIALPKDVTLSFLPFA